MGTVKVQAGYYRQFDADLTREVPAEGYGGWEQAEVELSLEHTAVVVMHAWEAGTSEQYPGWYRCVEYIPRAQRIAREVFPGLLSAVRASPLPLFHVVGGRDYYSHLPGNRRAVELAGPPSKPPLQADPDPVLEQLREFRRQHVFVGPHNEPDVNRGFAGLDFMPEARPVGDEGIAENADQLFALCREASINHLIYAGFAINWCLLLSPGGMADMQKHGVICSALRQAVTAVENRETARQELCKEIALWRVALAFGFVFEVPEFVAALSAA
jgi:hypothetical protein